jgi:hypothetical protein
MVDKDIVSAVKYRNEKNNVYYYIKGYRKMKEGVLSISLGEVSVSLSVSVCSGSPLYGFFHCDIRDSHWSGAYSTL